MLFDVDVLDLFISSKSNESCTRPDIRVGNWDCGGCSTLPFRLDRGRKGVFPYSSDIQRA